MALLKLEQLHECVECEARQLAPQKIPMPGRGNKNAELVIIGRSPGKSEMATRLPYSGKAQPIFEEGLRLLKLRREDVYVTNLVKCTTPNKNPQHKWIRTCARLWLMQELEQLVNARYLLVLGGTVLRYFAPTTTIAELNAKPFTWHCPRLRRDFIIFATADPSVHVRDQYPKVDFLAAMDTLAELLHQDNFYERRTQK